MLIPIINEVDRFIEGKHLHLLMMPSKKLRHKCLAGIYWRTHIVTLFIYFLPTGTFVGYFNQHTMHTWSYAIS